MLLAAVLWLVGVVVLGALLLRQAADPLGQYAFDFRAYYEAAVDIGAGRSPYDVELFAGPVAAEFWAYKYPPLLAQALVPLTALSLGEAAALWFCAQATALLGGTWLAARAGGASRSPETLLWCGVATTFFLPSFDTLWKGNVSGFLAFLVAVALVGGAAGGLGVALAALLKTTPGLLLLPAVTSGGVRRGVLLSLPVIAASFAASPAAWTDFARALPNLASGESLSATNLAPHSLVWHASGGPLAVDAVRAFAVGLGALTLVTAAAVARRVGGWPAAVALGLAAVLLIPSSAWYHYLAVLLPLVAFAWPRATVRARIVLLVGAASVSVAVAWLPLAVAGATALIAVALVVLWPRTERTDAA